MNLLFKAGKSANAGLLLIRLSIGSLFLLAGAQKILNLREFIDTVQATGKMEQHVAAVLGFLLPFMELIFGALYMIGLFTPVTSLGIAIMCLSFIAVNGPGHTELPFSFNFVFLACAIATMISGAGRFSFDALAENSGKKKEEAPPDTLIIEPDKVVHPSDRFDKEEGEKEIGKSS